MTVSSFLLIQITILKELKSRILNKKLTIVKWQSSGKIIWLIVSQRKVLACEWYGNMWLWYEWEVSIFELSKR